MRTSSLLLLAALAACRTDPGLAPSSIPTPPAAPPVPPIFSVAHGKIDEVTVRKLDPVLRYSAKSVEDFFGRPYPERFVVQILPDRASFDASFPPEWGMGETQCWMVATGVADQLTLLSPRVWLTEACEHDPDDAVHVRGLMRHELVHVFHGQHNPTRDFTGAEGIAWFLEGLATYASGQLEEGHAARAREAIEAGAAPGRLEDAWSGQHRYGVSGTLVAYLDYTRGREALVGMLSATTEEELLAMAGTTEEELLLEWEAFVLEGEPGP